MKKKTKPVSKAKVIAKEANTFKKKVKKLQTKITKIAKKRVKSPTRKPKIGDDVMVTVLSKSNLLISLPAKVVKVWSDDMINVVAFCDGANDFNDGAVARWYTSVHYSVNYEDQTWCF